MAIAKLSAVAGMAILTVTAGAREGERPSIRAVMHKEFTVRKAPLKVVKQELAAETTDWVAVRAATEKFVTLAEALAANQPRRDDGKTWKRLTELHLSDVRAMREGAEGEDLEAVRAAYQRIATSCKECHDAHKYQREE